MACVPCLRGSPWPDCTLSQPQRCFLLQCTCVDRQVTQSIANRKSAGRGQTDNQTDGLVQRRLRRSLNVDRFHPSCLFPCGSDPHSCGKPRSTVGEDCRPRTTYGHLRCRQFICKQYGWVGQFQCAARLTRSTVATFVLVRRLGGTNASRPFVIPDGALRPRVLLFPSGFSPAQGYSQRNVYGGGTREGA